MGSVETKTTTIAWHPSCTCYGSPERGPVTCPKCKGTGKERRSGGQQWIPDEVQPDNHNRSGYVSRIEPVETGRPCPNCQGTGTVIGDVWPDDVDIWKVAPSIVLDMCCGTGTVGEALASLQVANRYPGMFVGLDLKHSYLADLAQKRLQIEALEQWEHGIDGSDGKCLEGLPLFEKLAGA